MLDVVNKPIADDDPRVASVGTLWADGRVVSHAAILVPGVAVAPPFGAAQADTLKIGRRGGPIRYSVLQVTARNPFAVLTYSDHGTSARLGGGRPAVGSNLNFVAYDEKADVYFGAEGQVASTSSAAIVLRRGFAVLPSWTGAPAFDEKGLLVGMIGRGAGGPIILDVLLLDELLASYKELAGLLAEDPLSPAEPGTTGATATPASPDGAVESPTYSTSSGQASAAKGVAEIGRAAATSESGLPESTFRWNEFPLHAGRAVPDPNPKLPPIRFGTQYTGAAREAVSGAESAAETAQPSPVLTDEELWERLSESGRRVVEKAAAARRSARDKIHMEHLVVGLYDGWKGFFAKSKIDEGTLRQIIREIVKTEVRMNSRPQELTSLPPLSAHVRKAFEAAAVAADQRGAKQIWSTHLLLGMLLVTECRMVKALIERGVSWADVEPEPGLPRKKKQSPRPVEAAQPVEKELTDDELWTRLSPGARLDFARAEGTRRATGESRVHTYHLIAGMFPGWRMFFERAGVKEDDFRAMVRREFNTQIPSSYSVPDMFQLPVRSRYMQQALLLAAERAEGRHAVAIQSADLLFAALAVTKSRTARALAQVGVRKEDLRPEDGPKEELSAAGEEPTPPGQGAGEDTLASLAGRTNTSVPTQTSAAPTPKVDSDLWAEQDRLGYEAFARTIAALITHKETRAPLTIGIKAPWGAGKTSLMKRVQHLLDGRAELSEENRSGARQMVQGARMTLWRLRGELKKMTQADKASLKPEEMPKLPTPSNTEGAPYGLPPRITVWFNAWKYQTSEQIWAGMAHCIISQVTARMTPLERELFWLRLHARRINTDEVRRKVHEVMLRMFVPAALMIVVVCALVIWAAMTMQLSLPWRWTIQGFTAISGLLAVIWKARETLGEKAAGTMKDLVREPDYEGKMGYLHLVESDIREVMQLVTEAGAKAPENSADNAALKGRSSTVAPRTEANTQDPLLATPARSGAPWVEPAEVAVPEQEKTKKTPLVVFVDDLDRCAPNKVAEVVEAINLFLCGDYPNCVFVLGMEPGMVAAALEVANKDVIERAKQMGVVDGTAPVGWRFMEKIVQMPIMIPPPTKVGRDKYVTWLVGAAKSPEANGTNGASQAGAGVTAESPASPPAVVVPPKEEVVQKYAQQIMGANLAEVERNSLKIVADAPPEEKHSAAEAGKRAYAQAFNERDPMIADFVQECAALVDGNPRQVKRFVNVFRFYSTLRYGLRADGLATQDDLPSDKVLAKFVSLSIQWPHAMDCLRGTHHTESDGRTISRLEYLEAESARINSDDATGDEAWKQLVGNTGMGLEAWAHARSFRLFLARGDVSLGKSSGHGLW